MNKIEELEKQKQSLVNIMYEIAFASRDHMQGKSNAEVAAWVSDQLKKCGFTTKPKGASWGVLTNK